MKRGQSFMRTALCAVLTLWAGMVAAASDPGADYAAFLKRDAKIGSAHIALRDEAALDLPEGYAYLPEKQAAAFMKRIGNDTDELFRGIVLPAKASN